MTPVEIDSPRDMALRILGPSFNSGNEADGRKSARAQAFATLAVADAIDRLADRLGEEAERRRGKRFT